MGSTKRLASAILVLILNTWPAMGQQGSQQPPPPPVRPAGAVAKASGAAATVNGQDIPEVAVQRALKGIPADQQTEARSEVLALLIDDLIVNQRLRQAQVKVEHKEVDDKVNIIRKDLKDRGQKFEDALKELMLTEEELRTVIESQLRWDKYLASQVKEPDLKKFFADNREMFDGTMVRARHILRSVPANDARTEEQEKAHLLRLKKDIEDRVAKELAKLPTNTDNLARENKRIQVLGEAFSDCAQKESICPSKKNGGDLSWFPRGGRMVEPFAKAAFALKPYQMSEVIKTSFGYHLILVTDRKPGPETEFDQVKEVVKEVYGNQLRENLSIRLRKSGKIIINPLVKS